MTRSRTAQSRLLSPRTRLAAHLLLAGALVVPALLFSGCKKQAATPTLVTVQAVHPQRGPISEQIVADAVLSPVAQAAIVPKITAPVKKFYVQRGAKVHKGELLAVLDNSDLTATEMDNKGLYQAAQGAYTTATRSQIPEQMQSAQVAVAQAKANLKLDEGIVKSRTKLFAEGAIPGRQLDSAKATLVQAQGAYQTAVKRLQYLRSVNEKAALQQAQGQLTSAKGKYEAAKALVGFSEIRSPINGVVTDRPLFDGETANAGTPLLTVMNTSTLIAKAHIAQDLAQQLQVGNKATIVAPGVTKPVPATVSLVSPALDPGSTTVEVWLKINNRNGELKVGTPVKAHVTGRTVARALKVPASAIQTAQDGSKYVMVVGSNGKAQRKPVKLGVVNNREVQVVSGITPSEQVITVGSYALDAGTPVKVTPATEDASKTGMSGGDN